MAINRPYMIQNCSNIKLEMLTADDTLNIFSDASMRPITKTTLGTCYGAVAVYKNTIIDEMFRLQSECTVPAAELRGIRSSLSLALAHRYEFRVINLFSDSQVAIFGLRDYIMNWVWDDNDQTFYNKFSEAKNQEIMIECRIMIQELSKTNIVNLFHQSGHVNGNRFSEIKMGADVFKRSNGLIGTISYDAIRYISLYNNYIDNKSRTIVRTTNIIDNNYCDAIQFIPRKDCFDTRPFY